jgi:fructose-1,6-bisphosphatase/inositol monophosphatase family enzyme
VSLQSTTAPETIDDLEEIENMAVELATLAGAEIVTAYGGIFTVRYKTGIANVSSLRDPVSEIDRRVETLIRARLAERFPARKTGSAALECALVAAGLLEVARFAAPNVWDVAGGIALVQAGGGEVRDHNGQRWSPTRQFAPVPQDGAGS